MPIPRGKPVRTTTYADANLMHDFLTGRSMSGILHFLNQTPIQWFAKKQATVETATYGSEFMVARQATEQILDLHYTLRMMGIPIDGKSWLFGDNQSVITSSTIPKSTLNKRHNALSYHRVHECIAMGIIHYMHVDGKNNPSDVLTKFLGYTKLRPLIQPLLFWKGETMPCGTKPIPQVINELQTTSPSGLRGVTNNNINPSNPSGSEFKITPSSEISTTTEFDMSEIFTENDEINPDNPNEYLKFISATDSSTNNSNHHTQDSPDSSNITYSDSPNK